MSLDLLAHFGVDLLGVGLELGAELHHSELYGVEPEPERAREGLFEQGAQIGLGLEHIAVGDLDGHAQLDAELVDDEGDLAGLDAGDIAEALFDQLADYAESGFAAAALFASQGDLLDRVARAEEHGEQPAGKDEVEHGEGDEQPLDEVVVKLALLDAAEHGDEEYDGKYEGDDYARGSEDPFNVLSHARSLYEKDLHGADQGLSPARDPHRAIIFHII